MDFGSVPEASNKIKISLALIAFSLIIVVGVTVVVMKYKINTENLIKEAIENNEPKTEVMTNSQIDHIDKEVHDLTEKFDELKNSLNEAKREIKWLRENCRCR